MSINVTPIPRLIDLATPDFTLGTANEAGSAETAVSSNSTLLAFDTTVPSTIAVASAATGVATVAARRDHTHGYALPTVTTIVITGSKTVGANGKSGVSIASAATGPKLYVYDVWIETDNIGVTIGPDINADETISAGVSTFVNRYGQGTATSDLVIVNGSGTSRTIQYRLYELES
ncbi:MAG: hypothetical protein CMH54_09925 [Myxococcales bacterium]|nr:hypothetical protein [Myxococcales bacterium]